MKNFLRKFHVFIGLKKDIKIFLLFIRTTFDRQRTIANYFNKYELKKLQIGSNISSQVGWLCSDICPITKDSIFLDATQRFPFKDNVFHYVYSEHMIEHISRPQGLFMLQECYRVLELNGKIRIATPDLETIVDVYAKRASGYANDYVEWITDRFIGRACEYSPLIVLNTLFRNWDHCFLYDANFLEKSLREAGFSNITRHKINMSDDINLRGIEQHHLNVDNLEMVQFETIIFEAQKI